MCDDEEYRKQLLPYIKEMPFLGLFDDIKGTTKYAVDVPLASSVFGVC